MNTSTRYCAHCGAANRDDAASCFTCGQPLSEAESLSTDLLAKPLLKGRYHLLARLGAGGFGAVYRAEDVSLGNRAVAIKEMAQSGLNPAELTVATEAFQREAYLLAGLRHSNLPHIYDYFREAGRWYLVMDFIEGQTLEALLEQTPAKHLPVNEALKIGLQLANVLDYLHTNQPPIIFRDLKPANVMLTATGHVYLIDFGIARLFKPGQTKDTSIIGTPGYLAPEGYGKAQTTPRSDIYSLGATLHRLLSSIDPGERPFFFAPLQPPVPTPLQALVAQMVQMDEQDRPASMAEVKTRLQQIEDGSALAAPTAVLTSHGQTEKQPPPLERGEAPPTQPGIIPVAGQLYLPTLPTPQKKAAITRRTAAIGLGAVLAGGAIWTLASLYAHPRTRIILTSMPTPAPTITGFVPPTPSHPTPIATNTTVYQIFTGHTQEITGLAWSPLDENLIASASLEDSAKIWDTTSQRVYINRPDSVTRMAWSPDGQYIASGSLNDVVHVWQASTGNDLVNYSLQALQSRRDFLLATSGILSNQRQSQSVKPWEKNTPLSGGGIEALAWSPDSTFLAIAESSMGIQIRVAQTGRQISSFGSDSNGVFGLVWESDGESILAGSGDPTDSVYLWDIQTGDKIFPYPGHTGPITALAASPDGQLFASGSSDNTVRVWYENRQVPLTVYKGHTDVINCIAWSPDGKRIASASNDGTVQIWDAATGGNIFIYRGHTNGVIVVAWSPKTNRIASGGFDTTVQIWQPQ
ncbi:MAG TPA: protein kinase [Ktedonobacterales bacterium]|nr:protein kinase [Ktedonobacterales bacterium]